MKHISALCGAALLAGLCGPAFAASHGMDPKMITCGDYTAMDSEGRMKAAEAMHMAAMETDDTMKPGTASKDGDKSTMTKTGDASAMSKDSAMTEESTMALATACEGHSDMMAMDAMMGMDKTSK